MTIWKMRPRDARILAQMASEERVRIMLEEIAAEGGREFRCEERTARDAAVARWRGDGGR